MRMGRARMLAAAVAVCLSATGATAQPASQDATAQWGERMQELYRGEIATTEEELAPYTGRKAAEAIVGEDRRWAYLLNYEQLAVNYGENVEFQLRRQQVILCPQTVDVLYSAFTPTETDYREGSRPELEAVVAEVTADCETERERALALMRFCRDLYKRDDRAWDEHVFGGTEEQLIAKGERLCECLGRLYVALCEIAGIPGRIVMHDIGGHITAEVLIGGDWAYVDPRCGVYCLKPDGSFASVWEIWQDPGLLRRQTEEVRAEVSDLWTWEERVTKCEQRYFHPLEVNGFQNYSLADAERYQYRQLTHDEAKQAGLYHINERYRALAERTFGLAGDGLPPPWRERELRRIPLAYRNDGFSQWFREPPMTREIVEQRLIDPFEGSDVGILVWGLGPGSVFCFDTEVGEVFGEPLTEEQWEMMRTGDRWVYENVTGLIEAGHGPLQIAVERGHELGLKVFARLEMQHEYGPADPEHWMWVAFVGSLNKDHPEYRIPGRVHLDFKHQEVRDFKLAILREAVEAGADGLSLDFVVYPPYFEEPDAEIMTGFMREIRAMADEVGEAQGREVEIMARVPFRGCQNIGLDPEAWMREGLVDYLVVSHLRPRDFFDIRIGDFVELGRETGCQVYGCLWHSLGFVTTDLNPKDEDAGLRRYDKPKTRGMYYAQALMLHRAGADGIQIAMSAGEWRKRPWFNDLADPEKLVHADKHYMADVGPHIPVEFPPPDDGRAAATRSVLLRIGDDLPAARQAGHSASAELLFYCRALQPGEALEVYVNGSGPLTVSGDDQAERQRAEAELVDLRSDRREDFVYEREWWKRGEHRLQTPPEWWRLEDNVIRLVYSADQTAAEAPLTIAWIDLLIDYDSAET
ncbi:MAG: hypothetical protein U9R79_10205 [Armatimonadota bacterium]|nr:hypothetical protein [Armatimonadota bacterium]